MKTSSFQPIGEVLVDYLRQNNLEQPLLERRLVAMWDEIMGPAVARLTRDVEIKDGVLKVKISSAALRTQLFECRFELIRKLNQTVGSEVIRDVRLL
ncbi:MAG: DUF721 domain-containing protein [Paludibacteraceae bacterium]|nr:DUF721 domain-containing protein [Paludibacteraceae bacterium]